MPCTQKSKYLAVVGLLMVAMPVLPNLFMNPAFAQNTLWISPTDWVSGDATLRINYPSAAHPATEITATNRGDLKWVFLALRLPPDTEINAVRICYQVSNSRSFISQVRLTEMKTPEQALVRHDDATDLTSDGPTSYVSEVTNFRPEGAITLALRLNFRNNSDKIILGAVGVDLASTQAEPAMIVDGIPFHFDDPAGDFGAWFNNTIAGLASEPRQIRLVGNYQTRTGLDLTSQRQGLFIDAIRFQLTWTAATGEALLDFTDSSGITVFGGSFRTEAPDSSRHPNPPMRCDIGLVMGRWSGEEYRSAGKHRLIGTEIVGWFNLAAVYNVSAETNQFTHCRFENQFIYGKYVVFHGDQQFGATADNLKPEFTGAFGVSPDHNGKSSSSGAHITGCRFKGAVTRGNIYVYGFDRLAVTDAYVASSADGPAHIVLDATRKGIGFPKFLNLYTHGEDETAPPWMVLAKGRPNTGIVEATFTCRKVGVGGSWPDGGAVKFETLPPPGRPFRPNDKLEINSFHFEGEREGILCDSRTELRGAFIKVRQDLPDAQSANIRLGPVFQGEIHMGHRNTKLDVTTNLTNLVGLVSDETGVTLSP